ncbi:MAG: hypothetical protein EOM80_16885 [Erysipelotrichia bacterium]|nr:hypothetical protein [Erysipelotrichia bacterium]
MPAARLSKKYKTGVTLIEILIAAGLLSLFMTAAFSVYRSGSRGFVTGSWRAEEQKKLQTFISALTRDLGQANSGLINIAADGSTSQIIATPLYINDNLYVFDAAEKFLNAGNDNWVCLLAFSISYPHIEANDVLVAAEQFGRWSGVSVWAKGRKIRYVRTGDPDVFKSVPAAFPAAIDGFPGSSIVGDGKSFVSDLDQNRNHTYDLSLEELALVGRGGDAAAPSGLELTFRSARYENGKKTDSEITQNAVVRLASQTVIVTF